MKTRRRWPAGALVALSAAVGLCVGLRAIARVEFTRFLRLVEVDGVTREGLGIDWSPRAVWPIDLQRHALDGLVEVLAGLFLAAVGVALLNAVILLAEAASERRGELAIRGAVGASPGHLARMLLRELRTLVVAGLALGTLLGLAVGGAARVLWQGGLPPLGLAATGDLAAALAVLLALSAVAHLRGAGHLRGDGRSALLLRAGTRVGADPVAILVRKALAATHVATAGTVLIGVLTLTAALEDVSSPPLSTASTVAIDVATSMAVDWSVVLATLADIPGMEAESLSTPGALAGLGVRDIAVAECGACSRGGLPAPLWNALADHHAVSENYFQLAGIDLVDGRAISAADTVGAEPVLVVNETFARRSFELGRPIGKHVQVGSDPANWYLVVGIVADQSVPGLGADGTVREAVYLSALQHRPGNGTLVLRGSDEAIEAAVSSLTQAGLPVGAARSLLDHRRVAAAPLLWARRVALALALITLLLTTHGIYVTALQTTRRRRGELAVRRALGASASSIAVHVLSERARVTAWGLAGLAFFGTLVVALLNAVVGAPGAPVLSYAGVGAGLMTVALLASAKAAGEAIAVEPATLLE